MTKKIKHNPYFWSIIFIITIFVLFSLIFTKAHIIFISFLTFFLIFVIIKTLKAIKRAVLEYLNGPRRFCKGEGIEIGSGKNPMLKNSLLVDMVTDFSEQKSYKVDYVADAHALPKIKDLSLNYVCASNALEHLTNPIKAILEWFRSLKHGGIIWLRIPDKRKTFDRKRERTKLSHLIEDFRKNVSIDDPTHIEDHNKNSDPPRIENHPYIHNHVWIPEDIIELFNYINNTYIPLEILHCENNSCKNAQDFWIVIKKFTEHTPGLGPEVTPRKSISR